MVSCIERSTIGIRHEQCCFFLAGGEGRVHLELGCAFVHGFPTYKNMELCIASVPAIVS